MIFLLIILLLILAGGAFVLGQYNGLVKQKNLVQESWHQVDVELKRRHDLIPNLVNTVQGYAQHESGTLQDVMKARSAAMNAGSPHEAAAAEGELSQALGRLIAVSEAYPDLKANQNFIALQNELTATEDRIASARRYYNANVRELNTKIETVPSKFFAGMAGATRADYFEAEDAALETPNVQFGPGGASAAPQVSFDPNAGQLPASTQPPAATQAPPAAAPEQIPTPEPQAQPVQQPQQPPQQPYGQ
ncbi:LemA protein [Branchiibius hedensis]|uniref:LemA protein n=1 Tax=Branchiibius hedensis TaxID=672460 RepID=A0A2Y9C259_9MICO|nr:LemA family protein [Branchiibius hedensis]PWJ26712.1 LemA protein [Branchiibius hedensis]SSA35523.1 LemA protein [Branchiibius hedensis]